jgi:dihydroflavonol-4-reductase
MQILVTGANGHLGFNLVSQLIHTDHKVRGSIRSLKDTSKLERLKAIGDVEIVEAELDSPDQLRAAVEGIDILFHTAAIYAYVAPGRDLEIIHASIKGIDNAFHAAADAKVKKIVLTSSLVTLPVTLPGAPPSDETHWTEDLKVPYIRAKTEGEKLAWDIARKLKINLVTILPAGISGPGFVKNTPTIDIIEAMKLGAMRLGIPKMNFPIVDVRDVAAAHIMAAEKDCKGRFVVCNDTFPTFKAMLDILHKIDPKIPLPLMNMPDFMIDAMGLFDKFNKFTLGSPLIVQPELMKIMKGKIWNVSNQRIKDVLGWRQKISLEKSLRDTLDVINVRKK